MLRYFFIPANKSSKVDAIRALGADEIIIDFEDSILEKNKEILFRNIIRKKTDDALWFRVPIRRNFEFDLDMLFLEELLKIGINRLVIPKLKSSEEFKQFYLNIAKYDVKIILLVEHPRLLIELPDILRKEEYCNRIFGLGLGSHDLMRVLASEHSEKQLFFPRNQILYYAKAYCIKAIDIASMNISKKDEFEHELKDGIEFGFDAKLLIHPQQLQWANDFVNIQLRRIEWAEKILQALPSNYKIGDDIEPFVLEGRIIEKAHASMAIEIMKKNQDNE